MVTNGMAFILGKFNLENGGFGDRIVSSYFIICFFFISNASEVSIEIFKMLNCEESSFNSRKY